MSSPRIGRRRDLDIRFVRTESGIGQGSNGSRMSARLPGDLPSCVLLVSTYSVSRQQKSSETFWWLSTIDAASLRSDVPTVRPFRILLSQIGDRRVGLRG